MLKEKVFKVSLITKEPFRIGGKEDPITGAENRVAKVGSRIAIPGPSLKGALRTEVENYLIDRFYDQKTSQWNNEKTHFQPCIPATRLSPDESSLVNAHKYRGQGCLYPCDNKKCREEHSICPVCYLFGAQGLNGFVRVPFLFADVATSELYSARIDRASKTVATGTNRPYEIVPAETKFVGELSVLMEDSVLGWRIGLPRPLKDRSLGDKWLAEKHYQPDEFLKEFIHERLVSINVLGGYKSKGCGKVELSVEPL